MEAPQQPNMTRRRALQVGGLAGLGAAGYAAYQQFAPGANPLGSNSDVRLGIIGLRGKGKDHREKFSDIKGCRITALCDCDSEVLDGEMEEVAGAKRFSDYRELLASKEVDAVVVATPNHWHAVMGVHALQAGKHLYIEKPVAYSISEGERLRKEAAKHPELVIQAGTQRRSDAAYSEAKEWLATGAIGAIERIRCVVYRQRNKVTRRKSPMELPATMDFDKWCGPAAKETLYRSKVHYDWHWDWNTGNGELGNNGIHFIDAARIILGDPALPETAHSIGGRFGWGEDAGQTPNTHLVGFPGDIPLFCEVRNLATKPGMKAMDNLNGVREGIVIECEGGTLAWPVAKDADGKKLKKFDSKDGHGHRVNWLQAINNSAPETVNAPLEQGLISSNCCHLGNNAHRTGSALASAELEAKVSSPEHTGLDQILEHLKRHAIDLSQTPLIAGSGTVAAAAKAERPLRSLYGF